MLGTVLASVLEEVGLEDQRFLAALIVKERLYLDDALLRPLVAKYGVPRRDAGTRDDADLGPPIAWLGPDEQQLQLQGWFRADPPAYPLEFLRKAVDRSASVCRVEPAHGGWGTGFLVAPDLVLTNYHVLAPGPGDDPVAAAATAQFRFGCVTAAPGREEQGDVFKPAPDKPLRAASGIDRLDYALLRLEPRVRTTTGIAPAPLSRGRPGLRDGLHILQHPKGQPLTVAISNNGVTALDVARGLLQYVSTTWGGSSGSPCFNDAWEVVALHHAQKAKGFGTIREGILLDAILAEIDGHLKRSHDDRHSA